MKREDFYLGHYDGCLVNPIVDKIFDDFKLELEAEYKRGQEDVLSRTCEGCKYIILNGEYENDSCGNIKSLMFDNDVSANFMCNKWK